MKIIRKIYPIALRIILRMVVAGLLLPSNLALAEDQIVIGRAYNVKGELEYIEHHTVRSEKGRIVGIDTKFLSSDFQKIGALVSDFTIGPQLGSYELNDHRRQYVDGARVSSNRIDLYHRKSPGADVKTKSLPLAANQVVGQGFNHYLMANLDALARGEEFRVKLVLPSELAQYGVRIRRGRIDGEVLHIRVEIDNWLMKLFAPRLDAEYNLKTGRLMRYNGISMVADAKGKSIKVSIAYEYEPDRTLLARLPDF